MAPPVICRRRRSGWRTRPTRTPPARISRPVRVWSCCWLPCSSRSCLPSPPPLLRSWASTRCHGGLGFWLSVCKLFGSIFHGLLACFARTGTHAPGQGRGCRPSAALHRGRLPPARKQPHPFRPRPGTYPQPLALSGDVVDKAGSPASILPAGHELGTEPVPLFRKITEEEVAQHRARWVAVGPLPIDGAHARDRISFSPRTAAARATNSAL